VRTDRVRSRLKAIRENLDSVEANAAHAFENWHCWQARGYPSTNGRGGSSEFQSSVEATALTYDGPARTAQLAEQQALDVLHAFEKAARRLNDMVLAAVNTTSQPGAEGCKRCALVAHPESWQPVYTRGLCSFCHEFEDRYGVLPHRVIGEFHLGHLGSRVPLSMVREFHADEFLKYHGTRK
jgi:hypothetical protein